MKVAAKYANQRFGGMNTMTFTNSKRCEHANGWYITVEVKVLWLFTVNRRFFVCSDCGEHHAA